MRKWWILVPIAVVSAAAASAAFATAGTSSPKKATGPTTADMALIKCGKTRAIGLMAPITGPAASLGQPQVHWAQYYVSTYNRTHKTKLRFVKEDTMLGSANGTAEAVKGAQALGSNAKVLGVVGPAGSNEVKATTGALKGAGLGFVSGSATNTSIATDGTRRGFFFRTVPTDDDQSKSVTGYIVSTLKVKRVYIVDDQEAYSI